MSSSEPTSEQLQQLYLSTLLMGRKRQQALLTIQAHVFHINQETKKTWVPVTESAVPVSFFYDVNRSMYRIIGVDGTQAVVNSCMSPTMNFTKTSQKFGQWTDSKSNCVYGLGFLVESDMVKFYEQFEEVKEAIRISTSSPSKSKLNGIMKQEDSSDVNANSIYPLRRPGLQGCSGSPCKARLESPKRYPLPPQFTNIHEEEARTTPDSHLKQENEKLRIALQQSSGNAKKWESERATLKAENASLTDQLTQYTYSVEEWKFQIASLKEQNTKLKQQILEAESTRGDIKDVNGDLLKQIEHLKKTSEFYADKVAHSDKEIAILRDIINNKEFPKATISKLQEALLVLKNQMEASAAAEQTNKQVLNDLNLHLGQKLAELVEIQQKIKISLQ